jgi:DNA-binding response OmpR family regulator
MIAARPRILIVEDEPALALLMGDLLRDEGFSVRIENSARATLEGVMAYQPDVVIFDWRLQEMDGEAFYQRLRDTGVRAPAILCTAMPGGDALAARLGVSHVAKPFDIDEFLATVRKALEGGSI